MEAKPLSQGTLEGMILGGDLSKLNSQQKVEYITCLCQRLGLDPATNPLKLMSLNGKQIAYADRSCAAQLNRLHNLSHEITSTERLEDVYIVNSRCTSPDGRVTEEMGAVSLAGLKGEALANAFMKCRTKAMRRSTLTHVGLGLLDEDEVKTIPNVKIEALPEIAETQEWTQDEIDEAKQEMYAYMDSLIDRGYLEEEFRPTIEKSTQWKAIGDPELTLSKWKDRMVAWAQTANKKFPPKEKE